jgi:hypothetical protein
LFPSFFNLFPSTSFIFLFLCSMLVCHLATHWFIMCHTCFWLFQPSVLVRITLAYYTYSCHHHLILLFSFVPHALAFNIVLFICLIM